MTTMKATLQIMLQVTHQEVSQIQSMMMAVAMEMEMTQTLILLSRNEDFSEQGEDEENQCLFHPMMMLMNHC